MVRSTDQNEVIDIKVELVIPAENDVLKGQGDLREVYEIFDVGLSDVISIVVAEIVTANLPLDLRVEIPLNPSGEIGGLMANVMRDDLLNDDASANV